MSKSIKKIISICGANERNNDLCIFDLLQHQQADLFLIQDLDLEIQLEALSETKYHKKVKYTNVNYVVDIVSPLTRTERFWRKKIENNETESVYLSTQYKTQMNAYQRFVGRNSYTVFRCVSSWNPSNSLMIVLSPQSKATVDEIVVLGATGNTAVFGCKIDGMYYFTAYGNSEAMFASHLVDSIITFINNNATVDTKWMLSGFFPRTTLEMMRDEFEDKDVAVMQRALSFPDERRPGYTFVVAPVGQMAKLHVNRCTPFLYGDHIPLELYINIELNVSLKCPVTCVRALDMGGVENIDPDVLMTYLIAKCDQRHFACHILATINPVQGTLPSFMIDSTNINDNDADFNYELTSQHYSQYIAQSLLTVGELRVSLYYPMENKYPVHDTMYVITSKDIAVLGIRYHDILVLVGDTSEECKGASSRMWKTILVIRERFSRYRWFMFANFSKVPEISKLSSTNTGVGLVYYEQDTHYVRDENAVKTNMGVVTNWCDAAENDLSLTRVLFPNLHLPVCIDRIAA